MNVNISKQFRCLTCSLPLGYPFRKKKDCGLETAQPRVSVCLSQKSNKIESSERSRTSAGNHKSVRLFDAILFAF